MSLTSEYSFSLGNCSVPCDWVSHWSEDRFPSSPWTTDAHKSEQALAYRPSHWLAQISTGTKTLTGSDRWPTATSKLAAALSALLSWIKTASSPLSSLILRYSRSSCGDFCIGLVNTEKGGIPACVGVTRRQFASVAIPAVVFKERRTRLLERNNEG